MGQGVAEPVQAASLMGGVEHPASGGAQAFVAVGCHQLHTTQAAIGQGTQEVGPERLRL